MQNLIPWSHYIILNFLGKDYINGVLVLGIMLMIPIHQTFASIIGISYALEMTKSYVLLRFWNGIRLITTYILIAPKDNIIPGFGLASIGLAIKTLSILIITCNIEYWYLKKIKIKFDLIFQIKKY